MANLFDYLERELAPFGEKPLGPVDSAALSQLVMIDGGTVVPPLRGPRFSSPRLDAMISRLADLRRPRVHPADLLRAEHYHEGMFGGLSPDGVKRELAALVASPRFRDIELTDYAQVTDEKRSIQFAAVTFVCPGCFAYVAYRGTDVGFAGWRENFEAAYAAPTRAQDMAVEYLELAARHVPRGLPLFVGGHSKGGNYALYAALTCSREVQDRIARVYVHDGPGFKPGLFSAQDYDPLLGRIDKTVPQDSLVGLLLDYPGELRVVRSDASGLMQHSLFSWQVDLEEGDFEPAPDGLSDSARFTAEVISDWIAGYDEGDVAAVTGALFRAIEASGARDASDILLADGRKLLALVSEAARQATGDDRATLGRAVSDLTACAVKRVGKGVLDAIRSPREKEAGAAPHDGRGDAGEGDGGAAGADLTPAEAVRGAGEGSHGA